MNDNAENFVHSSDSKKQHYLCIKLKRAIMNFYPPVYKKAYNPRKTDVLNLPNVLVVVDK